MKRILLLILICSTTLLQGQQVYRYWVSFADKTGSQYSLDRPTEFLSQRALDRRSRQLIAIDSLDLPVSAQYLQAIREAGFGIQHCSKWLNGAVVYSADSNAESTLMALDFVTAARYYSHGNLLPPDITPIGTGIEYEQREYIPFDSTYYRYANPNIATLNGAALHRGGYQGEGMIIGVCDGGFPGVDSTVFFDSLRADGRILATRDFVWQGDNIYNVHVHGTLVLSTMASLLPGFYVGTAPKASYVLCRTENTEEETLLEEYNWVAAAEYLDSLGADIITTSLGYFYFDDSITSHTLADLDGHTAPMSIAADIAVTRGMLVINAAGNDGQSDPEHLNSPADAENVLTVGACNAERGWATFSSYGPTADGRIKPDILSLGLRVACCNAQGLLQQSSGTSLATPILAGMMACLWQRYPSLSPAQLCDSVRTWGSDALFPNDSMGYGIPDFGRALPEDTTHTEGINLISQDRLGIYPNPATSRTAISIHASFVFHQVVITDMMGRTVATLQPQHDEITLPQLPTGIYLLQVIGEDESLIGKVLIR